MKNLHPISPEEQESFLKTFPLIKCIAAKKLKLSSKAAIEDVFQTVAMRLWYWRTNGKGHDLSEDEWQRMANTTTHNEIRRFFRDRANDNRYISISNGLEPDLNTTYLHNEITGNSELELESLVSFAWQKVLQSSLRERYALLLQRPDLITLFTSFKCCTAAEIATALNLTTDEFGELIMILPLSDKGIAGFIQQKLAKDTDCRHVFYARYRITAKLRKALIQGQTDEKTSVRRNTVSAGQTQTQGQRVR